MDDLDLDAIRARAIAAGGADARWTFNDCCDGRRQGLSAWYIDDPEGKTVVYGESWPHEKQAAHIAGMDPATTLALLDEIERLKLELMDAQDYR